MQTQLQSNKGTLAGLVLGALMIGSVSLLAQGAFAQRGVSSAQWADILSHMSVVWLDDGQGGQVKTVRFSGVNVQVVNGSESASVHDGTGNLIVGYNGMRGTGDDRTGSHNLIVGEKNNYLSHGSIVAGLENEARGACASVFGGANNCALANLSSVVGGVQNVSTGLKSTILSGVKNKSDGEATGVVAGFENNAFGICSAVVSGARNMSVGKNSCVSGGADRSARGEDDWRAGTMFEDM